MWCTLIALGGIFRQIKLQIRQHLKETGPLVKALNTCTIKGLAVFVDPQVIKREYLLLIKLSLKLFLDSNAEYSFTHLVLLCLLFLPS